MKPTKPTPTRRLLARIFAHTVTAFEPSNAAYNLAAFRASCLVERLLTTCPAPSPLHP